MPSFADKVRQAEMKEGETVENTEFGSYAAEYTFGVVGRN
jgi:hypothetical protein